MSYGEDQKRKNIRQNKIILIILLLILTNFTTFLMTAKLWQSKILQVANNCHTTNQQHKKVEAFNVKIPIKKVFLSV